jgi:5'-phosphate synthase pdxT subunit
VKPLIGVLALQGGVEEHISMLKRAGCRTVSVRLPEQLEEIQGLIIPGGESTALIKLLYRWELVEPVRKAAERGLPVWGTCAGSIVISSDVTERDHRVEQDRIGLAPVRAVRNSFGRQVASFQQELAIEGLQKPFPGVFIRAPLLIPLRDDVEVLCSVDEGAVFLRFGNIWLSSFHPELTDDIRVHALFLRESGIGS